MQLECSCECNNSTNTDALMKLNSLLLFLGDRDELQATILASLLIEVVKDEKNLESLKQVSPNQSQHGFKLFNSLLWN